MTTPLVLLPSGCGATWWRDWARAWRRRSPTSRATIRLPRWPAVRWPRAGALRPGGALYGRLCRLRDHAAGAGSGHTLGTLRYLGPCDDEDRKATRRKGIESVRLGRFIGVSKGLLASLVAPQHLRTPVAADVQAMSERVGPEAYLRQQTAILGRIDSRPTLGTIGVPTLVGVGESDRMIAPELSREIAEGIAGARLVIFPDSAHLPTMENPQAVVAAMREWLQR